MQNLQKFYIDGQWVAPQSSKKMPVVNPATEEVIGEAVSYTHLRAHET